MFHYMGVLCSFAAHFAAVGKKEILEIMTVQDEKKPTITDDYRTEWIGRLLAYILEAMTCTLCGSIVFDIIYAKVKSAPASHQLSPAQWQLLGWFAVFFACLTYFNAKLPHTTWFTRACVDTVARLGLRSVDRAVAAQG